MNIENNKHSGERLSFYKLFKEKKYRVLIPIIQRDYAQGRKTTKEIRSLFLEAIYNYLNDNKPNRDLDFVYGSLKVLENKTNFIPLDGQQRLTTLFLIHWYLYQISDNFDAKIEFKDYLYIDNKSMFTYETRISSSDFCNALMNCTIEFNNLYQDSLSKSIINSSWFFYSWKHDPTIKSMLVMLDAIHEKFHNKKDWFERLIDNEKPIITFLFLNLQDFKLTDDLYIKMNSRGKQLTPFENFKAKVEQYISTLENKREFYLSILDSITKVSFKKYFSYNIDTKWANLFWNYQNIKGFNENENLDKTFDDELMNFIRVIFTNQYSMNCRVSLKEKDDNLEYLLGTNVARKRKDYSDIISFNKYVELHAISNEGLLYLIDALDCLTNGNGEIKKHVSKDYDFYFDEEKVFENALKHEFTSNHERLCFHAYIRFLITKSDKTNLDQWMRVIHNLSHPENTIIDSASEVANAIKSIENLLKSNDILEYLKQDPEITIFSSHQVIEEKIKAHLITKNEFWKKEIESIENHRYFNGQIGFILNFSGIIDYYLVNKNCEWNEFEDIEYLERFKNYSSKASKIFANSYDQRINDEDFVFERAVLTKGDYTTSASQFRKNLLSTNLVKNNIKRDHSWKRLLRITNDHTWKDKQSFVKEVFDDKRFDEQSIIPSLNSICLDEKEDWRNYFIQTPDLIIYCNQGFIRYEADDKILLYSQSQSNHLHVEMYTYYLWITYFEKQQKSYETFKSIYYKQVKSIEEEPCIVINNIPINDTKSIFKICYRNNNSNDKPYTIILESLEIESYNHYIWEGLENQIKSMGFDWDKNSSSFIQTCENINSVIDKIDYLDNMFKD